MDSMCTHLCFTTYHIALLGYASVRHIVVIVYAVDTNTYMLSPIVYLHLGLNF